MNEKLIEAQDVILGRTNQICRKLGLNTIMAQLYVILYIGDKPISLNEMVERLKISKASVSVNIRALERYGAVRKFWVKGSRKDYYEAEMNVIKVITERVKSMTRDRLSETEDAIKTSYDAVNGVNYSSEEEQQAIKAFKQKLDTLRDLQKKAQFTYGLFNSNLLANISVADNKKDSQKETSHINRVE